MNRRREQGELLYGLGKLLGPLEQAAANPSQFDRDEQERIRARFQADWVPFYNGVARFCSSEPGHRYGGQQQAINQSIQTLELVVQKQQEISALAPRIKDCHDSVAQSLLSIPIPLDSAIYEARTPFTTYCLVKDLCSTAQRQLVWLDRYFDQTIFHRFLIDTPQTSQVVLVTQPTAGLRSPKDKARASEFMDISKLFALERGPQGYRLIENHAFHDRWLRCDDKLLTLGGSIKDLDKGPFTVSRLDSTAANVQHFDDAVALGIEIFGPNHPTHP